VILILGALALVASAEAADTIKDVRVINTAIEPVPVAVQGTASVSGSVGVTSMPNVNLAPGASVGVTSMPNVNLAPGASVGVTSMPNVNLAPGASVNASSADKTVVLWDGLICGTGASGSGSIDVSGAKEVTVLLHGVLAAGADTVFIGSFVGNTGYGVTLAELTVPNVGTTAWHSTMPGLTLDLFCSGGVQPSTLAAAVYGHP